MSIEAGAHVALALVLLPGQQSLLDMPEEPASQAPVPPAPASPGAKPKPKSALDQEEEPVVPRPTAPPVGAPAPLAAPGIQMLDPVASQEDEQLEVEEVCDVLFYKVGGTTDTVRIRLVPNRLRASLPSREEFEFSRLRSGEKAKENEKPDEKPKDEKPKKEWKLVLHGDEVHSVSYYEDRMLRRAAEALGVPSAELMHFTRDLSLANPTVEARARRAIRLLTITIREHDTAKAHLLRVGEEWGSTRTQLASILLNLRLRQIDLLLSKQMNQEASATLDQLRAASEFGDLGEIVLQQRFEELILTPAVAALAAGDHDAARFALEEYLNRYPFDRGAKSRGIRDGLIAAAQKLVDQAKRENNPKWLDDAKRIWPKLTGLDEVRRGMIESYPLLRCAYGSLPRHFTPFTARTVVDRHATSLLYDRLVQWRTDEVIGPHYVSQLATHRPLPQARGREFLLPRAQWSDSDVSDPHYCTAEDIRWTIRLLKKLQPPGYSSSWDNLFDDVHDLPRSDPFRVDLRLHRDYWQPLALMDFPILPKASFPSLGEKPEELEQFEQAPIGTGPYRRASERDTVNSICFVANPLYRTEGLPFIREIVIEQHEPIEARDQFARGNIHLLYGVRKEHVVELRKQGRRVDRIPARSVYFLAPNYRRPDLKNRELRLALAHAIDRPAILQAHFRPGNAARDHAALNGPFLENTWPFNPRVPAYSTAAAKVHFDQAQKAQLSGLSRLTLVYPGRDPDAAAACGDIQRHCQLAGLNLAIEAVEPDLFHDRIVKEQNFDLAYWRHDFKDESYWLWPLLNPAEAAPGGSNFMGYTPNEDLERLFARLGSHKMFRTIQEASHGIHELIHREAVLIPLWQLDTYVAVSDVVKNERFSAFDFFESVETWRLEAR